MITQRFLTIMTLAFIIIPWAPSAFATQSTCFDASRFLYSDPWVLKESVTGAFKNHLLTSPATLTPSEIQLNPSLKGPQRIILGLHYEKTGDMDERYYGPAIMARLDNDSYRTFLNTKQPFAEVEFKIADMTNRTLIIASLSERPAFIDYVRFEPVDAAAFQAFEQKQQAPPQKDVIGICDVNMWMLSYTTRSKQDFFDIVGQHKAAGFNRLYWMANAGALFYHSAVGTRYKGDKRPITVRSGYMVENFHPLESGVKAAHEMGIDLWGWYRLNNNFASPQDLEKYGDGLNSEFFMKHPEFRLIRADGSIDPSKYSFAYPEVRAYVREICIEMVRKGVGGLMLDLLRHPPLAGYEPPLIEGYKKLYGIDPRTIKTEDTVAYAQWTSYRARNSFTQFVIELSEELKRLGLSVPIGIRCSLGPMDWNRKQGMDVKDLVHRGLVKEICLMNGYLSKPGFLLAPYQIAAATQPYFDLCRGRNIRLICGLHGRGPEETLQYASFIDEAGYDGVAIYESEILLNQPHYSAAFRNLKFQQKINTPWLTASSARNDLLIPWQPAVNRPGELWQINLPKIEQLKHVALRFDPALPNPPTLSFSNGDNSWQPLNGELKVNPEGWLTLDTSATIREMKVTLPEGTASYSRLIEASLDFEEAKSLRIGEVQDGRISISPNQNGVEVRPGVVFEAKVKGSPQTSKVDFFWDGVLVHTERQAPFTWATDTTLRPGSHTLKVRLADSPLTPSIDKIQVKVIGPQSALQPMPPSSSQLIASEDFESLSIGSNDLPNGWYFSRGFNETYERVKPKGEVRIEQAGGSHALHIIWSGQGPRMNVNFDFGSYIKQGMVEFDMMVPDKGNQRLAGLFEDKNLNLAMYLVDRGGKMTYHTGIQSHQSYMPPAIVKPGIWRHIRWEWNTANHNQTIYIDNMGTPAAISSGVRIPPQKGIDHLAFFFFENQPAEIVIDNVKLSTQ